MSARQVRRVRARAGWTVLDQVLSSMTNFVLGLAIARRVSADAYGAFAIGFTVYSLIIGVSRGFAGDPLIIRFSAHDLDDQREAGRNAAATGLAIGVVVGVVLAAIGLAAGGLVRASLLAFAVAIPLALWQDPYRYEFFASRRPQLAAANDFAWLLVIALCFAGLFAADAVTPAPYVLAWGIGAAGGVALGVAFTGALPALKRVRAWVHAHRDLNARFAGEFLLFYGGPQVVLLTVGIVAGYDDIGGLRGALVLLGPLLVLAMGLSTAAIPEAARIRDADLRRLRRGVYGLAALLGCTLIAWVVALAQLSDDIGEELLGATWPDARDVIVPLGLAVAGAVVSVAFTAGLRALAAAGRAIRAAVPAFLLLVVGGVVGAVVGGGTGAAVGMIGPAWIGAALYGGQFVRAARDAGESGRTPSNDRHGVSPHEGA